MALPPAPIRNAVEHEDRVAIILNRSGTSASNPIVGTDRLTTAATIGLPLRLSYPIADPTETILSAKSESINDIGTVLASVDLKAKFSVDAANLVATADIDAGSDIVSSSAGSRSIVTVHSGVGALHRVSRQQVWVRDMPADAVTFDGQTTTAGTPLSILVSDVDVTFTAQWSVQLFPSWNDEIARQHGADTTLLGQGIVKPYGGSATVEVYDNTGTTLKYSERPCEELTTMSYTGLGAVSLGYQFRFRAKTGSSNYVVAYAYVDIDECPTCGGATPTASSGAADTPPDIWFGPPDDPGVPDPDTSTLTNPGTPGRTIDVVINNLGTADSTGVDVVLRGYAGGTYNDAGAAKPFVKKLAEQSQTYTTTGTKTITIGSALLDASFITVEVNYGDGSTTTIGNTISFYTNNTDVADPAVPTVTGVSYAFSAQKLSFNITDLGFSGQTVTANVVSLDPVIESGGAAAQDTADLHVAKGETFTKAFTVTGTNSYSPPWVNPPTAVVVWFSNSYGATASQVFDDGATDANYVKTGPVIALASLAGGGTSVNFTLAANGNNVGNFTVVYKAIDVVAGTVSEDSSQTVTTTVGSHSFTLQSGDTNPDFLIFSLTGEQGHSNALHIDNYTPA